MTFVVVFTLCMCIRPAWWLWNRWLIRRNAERFAQLLAEDAQRGELCWCQSCGRLISGRWMGWSAGEWACARCREGVECPVGPAP